ncbi:MAG: SGNH/GDSL hydrolase family protein [Deltaproteobacteria bacterium]|nr:SGNH/GDSL hydrolase family protein [Deltaproteobacteria bacterium]
MKTDRYSALVRLVLPVLDAGIIIFLITVPIIMVTGGFGITVAGITIKANSLFTPVSFLLPLVFLRLLVGHGWQNTFLVGISVVVALAAIEGAIRIWSPPLASPGMVQIHRASPVLGYELVPGARGYGHLGELYQINAHGFRDVELSIKKPASVRRIMVIGDSFTFGMGVELKDTYPKQLESILNDQGIVSEVINCAVVGYNMWQYYEQLKNKVVDFGPDLVILGIYLNDLGRSTPPYRPGEPYSGENPFEPEPGNSKLRNKSVLWTFLHNADTLFKYKNRHRGGYDYLKSIEKRKRRLGPENKNYAIMTCTVEKEMLEAFSRTLEKMAREAERHHFGLLVVMIPDAVQLNEMHLKAVNRFVGNTCLGLGIPFIDLATFLETDQDPLSLYLFPVDAHNSPRGLRMIAETISSEIQKRGLSRIVTEREVPG